MLTSLSVTSGASRSRTWPAHVTHLHLYCQNRHVCILTCIKMQVGKVDQGHGHMQAKLTSSRRVPAYARPRPMMAPSRTPVSAAVTCSDSSANAGSKSSYMQSRHQMFTSAGTLMHT